LLKISEGKEANFATDCNTSQSESILLRFSFVWDVTQRLLIKYLFIDVSRDPIDAMMKAQAVQREWRIILLGLLDPGRRDRWAAPETSVNNYDVR
jgi:hypothetical protein